MPDTVVLVGSPGGGYCHNCGQNTAHDSYNICILALLIIIAICWFPVGLYCLLLLPTARVKRCSSCGHVSESKPATFLFVTFGIIMIAWLALILFFILFFGVFPSSHRNYDNA